jgi:hypothetical protein
MSKPVLRESTVVILLLVGMALAALSGCQPGTVKESDRAALRSEARAAMGVILTAEQAYLLKAQGGAFGDLPALKAAGLLDLSKYEKKWEFTVVPNGGPGFTAAARHRTDGTIGVRFEYTQSSGGRFLDN